MSCPEGFLNVLKPPGMTSHDVIYRVRRLVPRKTKVGHLGTLDPAATGVLPVAVAGATKLIPLLPDHGDQMKAYLAEIVLGVSTDSDDLEGEVLTRAPRERVEELKDVDWSDELSVFVGKIQQVPPQVSAIRKDGQRAYALARKGQTVELAARSVSVSRCDFLSYDAHNARLRFFLVCSSGTYVRSIARDLGEKLKVGGALAFLIRTQSGPFRLDQAVTLEQLALESLETHLLPSSFPFSGVLPERTETFREKGQRFQGDFLPGELYLAPNGLLRGLEVAGEAKVEAFFKMSLETPIGETP